METNAGYGYTALHAAVISHDLQKLTSLITEGYNPDVRDAMDFAPLHVATLEGSTDIVEALVSEGCDVNAYTKEQMTSLHFAADREGAIDILSVLVSSCDVNARNKVGRTALHLAAKRGHLPHLRTLLDSGCDRGLKDKFGVTALGVAMKFGRSECVDLLLHYEPRRKNVEGEKVIEMTNKTEEKEGEMRCDEVDSRQKCEISTGHDLNTGILNETKNIYEDDHKNGVAKDNGTESGKGKGHTEIAIPTEHLARDEESAAGAETGSEVGNENDAENRTVCETGSETGDVDDTKNGSGNDSSIRAELDTGSESGDVEDTEDGTENDTKNGTGHANNDIKASIEDHCREWTGNETVNMTGNHVKEVQAGECACAQIGALETIQKARKSPATSKRNGGKTDVSKELLHLVQALVSWKRDALDNTLNHGRLCVACRVYPNTYFVESKLLDGVLKLLSVQPPFTAVASLRSALPASLRRSSRLKDSSSNSQSMLCLRDLQRNSSGEEHLVVLLSNMKRSMDSHFRSSEHNDHPRSFSLPSIWKSPTEASVYNLDDFVDVFMTLSMRAFTHPKAVEKLLDSMFTTVFSKNLFEADVLARALLKKSALGVVREASERATDSHDSNIENDLLPGVISNLDYVINNDYTPVSFSEAIFDALLNEFAILNFVLDERIAFFELLMVKSLEDGKRQWNADRTSSIFLQMCQRTMFDHSLLEKVASAILTKALAQSSCNGMALVTGILIRMGLLKAEEDLDPVQDLNAPLIALEHVFRQDFFPRALAAVFVSFLAKPSPLLCEVEKLRLRALKAAVLKEILPETPCEASKAFGKGFKRVCDALVPEGFWELAQDCCAELASRAWGEPRSEAWRAGESLLVSLGLIKSETDTEPVRSMRNALKLLKHVVEQPCFPEDLIPMFRLFLEKPNPRLSSCRKGVDKVLRSLQSK